MKTRLTNVAAFLILYIVFLSWYDGWGMDPYTPEEVEALASKAEALETNPEQIRNLRRLLKDDDGKINASSGAYVFMAFAEAPFVTSTGIPTTAR